MTKNFDDLFMSPKVDCVFKMLFGDERHKNLLKNFLRCAIKLDGDDLETIAIVGTELKREYPDDKQGILDVAAKTKSGVQINIEIQLLYESAMAKRTLYYWAKNYCGQLTAGHPYSELHRTIALNIVNFKMFETPDYKNTFYVMEKTRHEVLDDSLEIHFLELPKLPETSCDDGLAEWLMFINAENQEVADMLAKKNEEIREAVNVLEAIKQSEANRAMYLSREMAIHDAATRELRYKQWDEKFLKWEREFRERERELQELELEVQNKERKFRERELEAQNKERESRERELEIQNRERAFQERERELQRREREAKKQGELKMVQKFLAAGMKESEIAKLLEIDAEALRQMLRETAD